MTLTPRSPLPHSTGIRPPRLDPADLPNHVALVMDGNGRWAAQRGLPRTKGHEQGEYAMLDCVHGALELGIKWLSVYAFSTENWKRSPAEVRFLMGFNREIIDRRLAELDELGVRVLWAGRRQRLWKSVIERLENAQERTKNNTVMTLVLCINYGGRAEIADAVAKIAARVAAGELDPAHIGEETISRHLYQPHLPEVDLFIRSSGEQRLSNFLLWESAYAELVFLDTLWPDFDRRHLWWAIERYLERDRRRGGAEGQAV